MLETELDRNAAQEDLSLRLSVDLEHTLSGADSTVSVSGERLTSTGHDNRLLLGLGLAKRWGSSAFGVNLQADGLGSEDHEFAGSVNLQIPFSAFDPPSQKCSFLKYVEEKWTCPQSWTPVGIREKGKRHHVQRPILLTTGENYSELAGFFGEQKRVPTRSLFDAQGPLSSRSRELSGDNSAGPREENHHPQQQLLIPDTALVT